MPNDAIQFEPRWTTKEAANSVNISETTVRKYAQTLERECNYRFRTVNEKGDRRFSDHDITLLIEIKRFSDETGMNIASIAKMVMTKYGNEEDNTTHTKSLKETSLSVIPQGFKMSLRKPAANFGRAPVRKSWTMCVKWFGKKYKTSCG